MKQNKVNTPGRWPVVVELLRTPQYSWRVVMECLLCLLHREHICLTIQCNWRVVVAAESLLHRGVPPSKTASGQLFHTRIHHAIKDLQNQKL